jgi:hypothetical protein
MLRRLLGFALVASLISHPAAGQTPEIQSLLTMKRDLYFLAAPESEGRGPGTQGIDRAADYIAKQFVEAGLKPAGKEGYFQPFTITGLPAPDGPSAVSFSGPDKKTTELVQGKQFEVMGNSGSGKATGPLVFVGFGVESKDPPYNEYAGIDVKGKIVVMLRHVPRWSDKESPFGKNKDKLASLAEKIAAAESRKAAGVIVVNDKAEGASGDTIPPFSYLATATSSTIPCVHVKRDAIEPIIKNAMGNPLSDVEAAINENMKPRSTPLFGWTATIETSVKRSTIPVKNVIGFLEGSGPLAKEIIVVGAHYDHLGFGGSGSRAKNPKEKQIHHGADDNASGTAAMLELARRFAGKKDRQGRSMAFMAFSAEERGLLGSQHYCTKEPLFPLADTAAMVNLDMVGKLRPDPKTEKDKLIAQGTGTSKDFDALVDRLNKGQFTINKVPAGMGPSDHQSFYLAKIPVLFWTGTHPDYHMPSDTADRINYEGMAKIVDYVETVTAELVANPHRPNYIEQKQTASASGAPKGPKLGVVPNYESESDGLLLSGVSDGGAAAKAGLKGGDRIVEIAGRAVTNIETYMVIMSQQKTGQEIEITFIRDGKKQSVKATPQ